jgi:hypothetical protein
VIFLLPQLALRLVIDQGEEHGGVGGEHVPVGFQILLAHPAGNEKEVKGVRGSIR